MEKQVQMAAWAGSPEDAIRFIRGETSLDCLIFSRPEAPMEQHGWARVGLVNAEVVELKSENQLVQEAIKVLRSKKSKIYAEAEEAAMNVEARIRRLLAIENKTPQAVVLDESDDDALF